MTKIMLVEDDNNLREIYEARLAAEGYEIVSASDGEAALALAGKERPDMIISDVMMPKISGFEMLDILRNTNALRDVKVIMLTALGQAEDSSRANSLGADRYLVKSQVTLEDIVKTAHELLNDAPVPEPVAAVEDTEFPEAAEPAQEEIAEPAPEPVADAVPQPVEAPAAETMPDFAVAPEPQEPQAEVAAEPAPAPAPTDFNIIEPTVAPEPAPAPEAPSSVISIPVIEDSSFAPAAGQPASDDTSSVSDGSSDDNTSENEYTPPSSLDDAFTPAPEPQFEVAPEPAPAPEATEQPSNLHPISNLPFTPEPEEPEAFAETTEQAPAPEIAVSPTSDQPSIDYTSPENFNKFQSKPTPPVDEAPAISVDDQQDTVQTSADEEASIKSQIDAFIGQQDLSPEEVQPSAETEPTTEPEIATEPEEPVVIEAAPFAPEPQEYVAPEPELTSEVTEEPVVAVNPEAALDAFEAEPDEISEPVPATESAPSPLDSLTSRTSADTLEPVAEELNNFSAPVITPLGRAGSPTSSNDIAGRKSLTPISSPDGDSRPSIHQLLELEEAKTAAQQAASAEQAPKPNVNAYNPATVTGPQPPPARTDDIDPNSISL